jgi:hypothetical protein
LCCCFADWNQGFPTFQQKEVNPTNGVGHTVSRVRNPAGQVVMIALNTLLPRVDYYVRVRRRPHAQPRAAFGAADGAGPGDAATDTENDEVAVAVAAIAEALPLRAAETATPSATDSQTGTDTDAGA